MKLLEPGRIGQMEVRNRTLMAAMGIRGLVEPDGDWGERARAYYIARAAGGVGVVTTEMVFVSRALEHAARTSFDPNSPAHLESLRIMADGIHAHGARLSVQLTAGFGRVVPPFIFPEWWKRDPLPVDMQPVSASVNPNHYLPHNPRFNTRPLTTEEAAAHAAAFGPAARHCREAGADCVELHGHEGYLLDQFMTGLWNRREDRYGGSPEKRLTFAREAIAAIQREAGEDFPIIYRFGLTHYLNGGREPEEGLWIAQELEKMGVAALHVDAGCYETHWWPHPPQYQAPGCMVSLAAQVREVVSIPVIAVGRLHYPDLAEQVLQTGQADFIAMGRGLLADPEWVNKVAAGRAASIIPCIGCHEGCLEEMTNGRPTSCALNPTTGHELDWPLTPVQKRERLLVVGGGPAGLEAARAGAARGFDVTLWEAADRLGGHLWPAAKPDFKHDIACYLEYLTALEKDLPITIELNKKAGPDDILAFRPDRLVVATGAEMEPFPLPNDGSIEVMTAIELLSQERSTGKRVLVMGGGFIGCEAALYLARQGKHVTLTTRRGADKLGGDISDRNNRKMLQQMIADSSLTVLDHAIPERLEQGGVCVRLGVPEENDETGRKGGPPPWVREMLAQKRAAEAAKETVRQDEDRGPRQVIVPAQTLIFAGRLKPRNALAEAVKDEIDHVVCVGDCVQPDTIKEAVWSSFNAVRALSA